MKKREIKTEMLILAVFLFSVFFAALSDSKPPNILELKERYPVWREENGTLIHDDTAQFIFMDWSFREAGRGMEIPAIIVAISLFGAILMEITYDG